MIAKGASEVKEKHKIKTKTKGKKIVLRKRNNLLTKGNYHSESRKLVISDKDEMINSQES